LKSDTIDKYQDLLECKTKPMKVKTEVLEKNIIRHERDCLTMMLKQDRTVAE
jgi:hypothetical protein